MVRNETGAALLLFYVAVHIPLSDTLSFAPHFASAAYLCRLHCTHYLCPGTLACVHFPHHCPCPFPAMEDKVELGEGIAVCVSKGGYKAGEAARKIELARKGLL